MALSASDQILLQQALSQLAQSASSVAKYSSALNTAQQASATSTGNLSKAQNTSIGDYDKLSKALKSNSEAFKDTLKNINDYSKKVSQASANYQVASDNLKTFNDSIAAAGGMMTTAQRAHLASLTSILASAAEEQSKANNARSSAFSVINDIVDSTRAAVKYRDEYEKDFFGRQLASEIRNSLNGMAGQVAGTFSQQLLTLADVGRISDFANAQSDFIQSMISNNNTLDDSNVELGKKYVEMGNALGYASVEFDAFRFRIEGHVAGSSTMYADTVIEKVVDAQTLIAETINDSNEKLSKTIDRDLKSFSGQFNKYMYDNRSKFDELIDELRDIKARNGSLVSGAGRAEASEVISEAVNSLGGKLIPKLGELGLIVLKHYTREYDALTRDNVVTNRLMAWQLRLTEEQYRQTRGETKSFWAVANAEGQDQLDSFMDARYAQLKSVFGSDPVALSKISGRLIGLENLSNMTSEGTTNVLKSFKKLGLTSRLTNDQLEQMFTNIGLSNENQVLMASLNAKERKARMDGIRSTMEFGAGLGMSQESLEKFTKAMNDVPTNLPSVSSMVSMMGQGLTAFNLMKGAASTAGLDLSQYGLDDNKKNKEYMEALQLQQVVGYGNLSKEQQELIASMDYQIARFKAEAKASYIELVEKYGMKAGYNLLNMLENLDKTLETSKIKGMVDPITESLTALEKFGIKGKDVPKTLEELNRLQDELAKQREKPVTEQITGAAATAQRVLDATTGEGAYSDTAKLWGAGALGGVMGRYALPLIQTVLRGVVAAPLSKITPIGWVAAAAAAAGLYAINKIKGGEEEGKEKQPGATETTPDKTTVEPAGPNPNTLPSDKITAADTAAGTQDFNALFTEYMKSVQTQNSVMQDFLRNISTNSTNTKKVIDDWYKLYQDVHPITPNMEQPSQADTSTSH